MSAIEQNSFFKPAGRESRGKFWSLFLPYLLVSMLLYVLLLWQGASASVNLAGLLLCLIWASCLSGHIIRRMHDAGVSGFFCWLLLALMLVAVLLSGTNACMAFPENGAWASAVFLLEYVIIPVLHLALTVFCCLSSEAGENAYGASATHPDVKFSGTSWGGIIEDMLKLVVVMGILGGLCNLAMKPFETVNVTDSLVSLIRKGGASKGQDPIFAEELAQGMKSTPDFINTKDNTGRTPLMWAVYSNFNDPQKSQELDLSRVFYVKELLKVPGIRAQEKDNDGFTALHWATWSGMPVCSVELVAAGLDINEKESNGYTPLMLAAMHGNDETVATLLKLGADASMQNAEGKTALQLATLSESAYKKRDDWKYTLIFSDEREKAYKRTLSLLKNPPALVPLGTLRQEGQKKVDAAEAKKQEENGESVSAEEKAVEISVDKAAEAPAQTAPEQAPSADPQPLDENVQAGE